MGARESRVEVSEYQKDTNDESLQKLATTIISLNIPDSDCLTILETFCQKNAKTADTKLKSYRYLDISNNDCSVTGNAAYDNTLLHLAVSNDKRRTAVKIAERVPGLVFECINNLKRDNAAFELTPLGIAVATNPLLATEFLDIVKNSVSIDPKLIRFIAGEPPSDTLPSETELTTNDETSGGNSPTAHSEKGKFEDTTTPLTPDEGKRHGPDGESTVTDIATENSTQSPRKRITTPLTATSILISERETAHVTIDDFTSNNVTTADIPLTQFDNGGTPDRGELKSGNLASKDAVPMNNSSVRVGKDSARVGHTSANLDKASARGNKESPRGNTVPARVDKYSASGYKGSTRVNKNSTTLDIDSAPVDTDSATANKVSARVDNSSTNLNKASTKVKQDSSTMGTSSARVDKNSARVDKDSAATVDKDSAARVNKDSSDRVVKDSAARVDKDSAARVVKDSDKLHNGETGVSVAKKPKTNILGGTILMGQLPLHIAALSLIAQQYIKNEEKLKVKSESKDTNTSANKEMSQKIGFRVKKGLPKLANQRFNSRKAPLHTRPIRPIRGKKGKSNANTREHTDLEGFEEIEQVMDKLIEYGASVGNRNYIGDTVFHSILRFVNCFPEKETVAVKVIEYLIRYRIKDDDTMRNILSSRNSDEVTSLQLSVEFGQTKVFKALMNVKGLYYHRISPYDNVYERRTIDVTEFDKPTMWQAWKRSIQRQAPVQHTETRARERTKAQETSVMKDALQKKPKEEMEKHRKLVKMNVNSGETECLPSANDASDGKAVRKENTTSERIDQISYITKKWNSIKEHRRFNEHQSIIELLCSSSLSAGVEMVGNGVFEAIIERKWPSYRWSFYAAFLIHVVVLTWLSVYTIAKAHVIIGDEYFPVAFVTASQVLSFLIALVYFLQEVVVRCWFARQPFSCQAVHHNVVYRVSTIVFSILLLLDSFLNIFFLNNYCLIIALVIGTWNLLFFLRISHFFSLYVVLINEALFRVIFPFAVLAFMQVFIFSVGMHATFLLPENENAAVEDFDIYGKSFLNMGKLMVGLSEFSYLLNSKDDVIALILFGLFIVITFLLLINALVAVMTNGFADPQKDRVKVEFLQKLSIIVFMEAYSIISIPAVSEKEMEQYHIRTCPKDKHTPVCQYNNGRYVMSYRKVPDDISDDPKRMVHKLRDGFVNVNDILVDIQDKLGAHDDVFGELDILKQSLKNLNKLIAEGRMKSAPQIPKTIHIYHFSK